MAMLDPSSWLMLSAPLYDSDSARAAAAGSQGSSLMVGLLIAGGVLLVLGLALMIMYNGLVNLRQLCNESFADIDTELQRRHDLIPNLVSIVKGYAKHEKELFEKITELRGQAATTLLHSRAAPLPARRQAMHELIGQERMLGTLMGNLLVVAEGYPELKASDQFGKLMRELSNTEDRVQAARRFYNANVRDLNNRCEQFPSTLVAKMFNFERREFFEAENPLTRLAPNMRGMLGDSDGTNHSA